MGDARQEDQRQRLRMVGYNQEEIDEILSSPHGLFRVNSRLRLRMSGFTWEEAYQLIPREEDMAAPDKASEIPLPDPTLVKRALGPHESALNKALARYALPEALVRAVIIAESGGDPLARSPKGAMGLMQLMPATAREMGVRDPFDPGQNIEGGCRYLSQLWQEFRPRWDLTLAAYNAGPERVKRAGGIPDIPETKGFVKRVLSLVQELNPRSGARRN